MEEAHYMQLDMCKHNTARFSLGVFHQCKSIQLHRTADLKEKKSPKKQAEEESEASSTHKQPSDQVS